MNGRQAKKFRRIAPMILQQVALKAQAEGADMSKLPTVRQTYRMLKRKYVRGA